IPEQIARTYSYLIYNNSLLGYRISVEFSKEVIMITLRLIGLSLILLTLYIIYRVLFLIIT
ncbi:MAG: hypothetical protein QXT31_05940, partial [Candidatus Bathyarchaeia archaeon]